MGAARGHFVNRMKGPAASIPAHFLSRTEPPPEWKWMIIFHHRLRCDTDSDSADWVSLGELPLRLLIVYV